MNFIWVARFSENFNLDCTAAGATGSQCWRRRPWTGCRDIYYAKYYGKGGGNGQPGKKMKLGERKKEENFIKKGGKALKMHLFGL